MENLIPLVGQWLGYYEYGPDYGSRLHKERVQFRVFIDNQHNRKFEGRCVDFEGVGANLLVAQIRGFIDGNVISFTKHYPCHYSVDENGDAILDETKPHPIINYQGRFDKRTNTISGDWDLDVEVEVSYLEKKLYVVKGTWEMKRDD